jgi:ferredoxin-NADP reductase
MSGAAPERRVRVAAVTPLVEDVVAIDLVSDLRALPVVAAGSHLDLLLPDGLGERQYSLMAAPDGVWRIGVLREPDGEGGSAWVHASLRAGDEVRVRGPRNLFAFTPAASAPVVFLAAGIGITPISSMIAAASAQGLDWQLHYSGRARSRMALVDALLADHPDRISVYVSDEGTRADLVALAATLAPDAVVYCCGPAHYLAAVEEAFAGLTLHVERFEAKDLTPPVYPHTFEVELALTGVTVEVPLDRSILEAAEEAGAFVLSSCRAGTCGTCETEVIEGEVDHRDSILTPEEQEANEVMYVCVSRAACPRLVLEL